MLEKFKLKLKFSKDWNFREKISDERVNSPQSARQKSPTALKRLDISIKRTLKIGHRLCRFCAIQQKKLWQYLCHSFLCECDKKDTLFFYSFGFRILDTSVTFRFSFFIQPFDFLLLLWNFNFLKFMCHWFLPQKPICNVMYILYIYNTPSYIVLYSFLLEL